MISQLNYFAIINIKPLKVGCEIKSVKKESNRFSIVLSEPFVVEHEINRIGDWEGKEGIRNNFTTAEEGITIQFLFHFQN